jgi:hypothetical protein
MVNGRLIRKPWIDLILEGSKTWEIHGTATGNRGRIALIQSGTGTVIGVTVQIIFRDLPPRGILREE